MRNSNSVTQQKGRRRLRLGAIARQSQGENLRKTPTRREELLEIAAELFAARGFASVTVDSLSAAAGVSGPALYHHFESKEAILGEMLIDISHHLLESGRTLREEIQPVALLDALITMHVEFAVDHRALISVHFHDLLQANEADQSRVRSLQRQYLEIWVDAVLVRHPELSTPVARSAVHATLGLINSAQFSPRARRADMVPLLQTMASSAIAACPDSVEEDV